MLVLLLPDQVADRWGIICKDLEDSLPPIVGANYSVDALLDASLSGIFQMWLVKNKEGGNSGLLITTIHRDQASSTRMLLVYAAISYKGGKLDDWKDAYPTLEIFARSKGCTGIMGYTSNDTIVKYMKRLGCETDYKLVVWRW